MSVTSRSVRWWADPLVDGADIVVAGRHDAVARPELSGRGGGFMPLLLDTDFDTVLTVLGVRQHEAHLVHRGPARRMGGQYHHAGGGEIAELADHALDHDIHDRHGRGDPLARRAAFFEVA